MIRCAAERFSFSPQPIRLLGSDASGQHRCIDTDVVNGIILTVSSLLSNCIQRAPLQATTAMALVGNVTGTGTHRCG